MIDKTGPALGIAFSDQLLHGWDLALCTGQETAMPDADEQRQGIFKPEIAIAPDASPQDKLLAYTGRDPSMVP